MLDDTAGLPLDLPPSVEAVLRRAGSVWHDKDACEALVLEALGMAPQALGTRIAAYKFYFYRHRLEACLPHALSCVHFAADRLGVERDWRKVAAGDADFASLLPLPKLWLQALTAYGYVLARLGRPEGREALCHVAALDVSGKLGAARLVRVIDRGGEDEEDEE